MLPIIPGCRALIINSKLNSGEVIVGRFIGVDPAFPDEVKCWEVDRPMFYKIWVNNILKFSGYENFIPERKLMRIDGGEVISDDIPQYRSKPQPEFVD